MTDELTPSELFWQQELTRLATDKQNADRAYREKRRGCPHRVIQVGDSAKCIVCDHLYGWWCPKSPDHTCYYHPDIQTHGGPDYIQLIADGRIVSVPDWVEGMSYSDDWCVFCGSPDERK